MTINKSNNIIIGYFIKSIITSIVSIVILNLIFTYLCKENGYSSNIYDYFTIITLVLNCIAVTSISTSKLKNNLFIFGMLSNAPVLVLICVNMFVTKNYSNFVVHIVLVLIISAVTSAFCSNRKKRLKF